MKGIEGEFRGDTRVAGSSLHVSPSVQIVLVVSSDPGLSFLVERVMEGVQIGVVGASDPQGAADVFHRCQATVIVFDICGEEASAAEAPDWLNRLGIRVPMILVTDAKNRDEAIAALDKGAYDIVESPVNEKLLRRAILRGIECGDHRRFKRSYQRMLEEQVQEQTVEISRRKDFLQAILDSSTLVSIVLTDLEQKVLFWNTGARNIFGYSPEEIVGSKITRIYPGDEIAEDTVTNLRDMLQCRQGIVHGKMRQIAKDGSDRFVSLALTPMLGPDGEMEGTLGVGLDVSEEVRLNDELLESLEQIKRIQEISVFMMAKVAESRDRETGSHLMRIREYGRALCNRLSERKTYKALVTPLFVDNLVRSSVLHDIGKVAIPDSILMSNETFTPDERKIMMQHSKFGGDALDEAVKALGEESFLSIGREIAYYHHEHWDGNGYPFGLKGDEIPLSARIVAIADVYDALTTERRYKKRFSHKEACRLIVENSGRQFDPALVDVFMEVEGEFLAVRNRFASPVRVIP